MHNGTPPPHTRRANCVSLRLYLSPPYCLHSGFVLHRGAYLRNPFNVLDFVVAISSIITSVPHSYNISLVLHSYYLLSIFSAHCLIFYSFHVSSLGFSQTFSLSRPLSSSPSPLPLSSASYLFPRVVIPTAKALRALRAVRALRLLSIFENTRVVLRAFARTWQLVSASLLILVIVWLMFAVVGVQAFRVRLLGIFPSVFSSFLPISDSLFCFPLSHSPLHSSCPSRISRPPFSSFYGLILLVSGLVPTLSSLGHVLVLQ